MEYLGHHEVMRKPLVARQKFPQFADHLSTFLANVLFRTSDLSLTGLEKKTNQSRFINPHLCKIQEDFVFTNPYMESPENNHNPLIAEDVQAVRRNTDLKLAIVDLKEKFMTQGQALIHSDLHTGSIMVNQTDTRVIDPEFCFYGPMGYDIGAVISNLMMNYASHFAHTPDPEVRQDYQAYLIETIRQLWTQFAAKFETLWVTHNHGELAPTGYWQFEGGEQAFRRYRERYLRALLRDTFGLGACESLRRMMGIVTVWDVGSIADMNARAAVERIIIRVSTRWILEHGTFTSVEDALRIVAEESA
jgi:5-methylthioribose kinase